MWKNFSMDNLRGSQTTGQRQISLSALLSALPDFGLATLFLITWITPDAFDEKMVSYLVLVMLMEFVIIHSSGFMGRVMIGEGDRKKRGLTLVGLGLFYTLFVGGFALSFEAWWPIAAFWGMTLNRILFILLGQVPKEEEKILLQKSWAVGALFYLGSVFLTVFAPIPELGISWEVVRDQEFTSEGLWVEDPEHAIACGFLYFSAVAVSELYGHRWLKMG